MLERLHLCALCAPHLEGGGWGNSAYVVEVDGREILVANKGGVWLAPAASVPFSRLSYGYVGQSDGWTDLAADYLMDWEFDRAPDGNVALTGELDLDHNDQFTLGLAFGGTRSRRLWRSRTVNVPSRSPVPLPPGHPIDGLPVAST